MLGDYSIGSSSSLFGTTIIQGSNHRIANNVYINCSASSFSRGDSHGANAYGGAIALDVGAYSYATSLTSKSSVFKSMVVTNAIFEIKQNTIQKCISKSESGISYGANAYGGGISLKFGIYSYSGSPNECSSSLSNVSGDVLIAQSAVSLLSNTLTHCSVLSSSRSSNGASSYGGAVSLVLGAYSYSGLCSASASNVVGGLNVSMFSFELTDNSVSNSSSVSDTKLASDDSEAFGGAVSVVYQSYVYPRERSLASPATVVSSGINVTRCSFSSCVATASSTSCSPGKSNAAGGALFVSAPDASVSVLSTSVYDSSVDSLCASSLSHTYSVGGGVAFF